jgi:hypothetical protein
MQPTTASLSPEFVEECIVNFICFDGYMAKSELFEHVDKIPAMDEFNRRKK